ncbi:hypothetical protein CAPTEDRAFT_228880 [Capitella teleta]|uniref:IgGFc-binding protein N-terminal domain-containing protein n=1 Tax=Capitella teleta TaxID=283909 RepID=R7TU89_CAPTE|nr:hypothetical protein CAPTEDRAFT_228880 [Capitella teleta]|eukprot:ELT95026.1 hypothetical protein CAPTEDRAFT_228880 [Capitella teleta]
METSGDGLDIEIFAASGNEVVTVSVTAPAWTGSTVVNENFALKSNEAARVTLPKDLRMKGTDIFHSGIRVTASSDIVVYGFNRDNGACGGYTAIPTDALGTEYFVLAYYPQSGIYYPLLSEAAIVATEPNTRVHIELLRNRGITVLYNEKRYDENGPLIVDLVKAYDVLQIQAEASSDLTGTKIYSEGGKKIAVFSGNILTDVAGTTENNVRDHIIEQMPPSNTWGKSYNIVPLPLANRGDEVKIGVVNPYTTINYSQDPIKLSQSFAGNYVNKDISDGQYVHFTGNDTLFVAQFPKNTITGSRTYPAMINIPPEEQYLSYYRFMVPEQSVSSLTNYVIVAAPEGSISGLRLDSAQPSKNGWSKIPDSNPPMVGKAISVGDGLHEIYHIDASVNFMALVYGYSDAGTCSYGYPAGMCLQDVSLVSVLLLIGFPFSLLLFILPDSDDPYDSYNTFTFNNNRSHYTYPDYPINCININIIADYSSKCINISADHSINSINIRADYSSKRINISADHPINSINIRADYPINCISWVPINNSSVLIISCIDSNHKTFDTTNTVNAINPNSINTINANPDTINTSSFNFNDSFHFNNSFHFHYINTTGYDSHGINSSDHRDSLYTLHTNDFCVNTFNHNHINDDDLVLNPTRRYYPDRFNPQDNTESHPAHHCHPSSSDHSSDHPINHSKHNPTDDNHPNDNHHCQYYLSGNYTDKSHSAPDNGYSDSRVNCNSTTSNHIHNTTYHPIDSLDYPVDSINSLDYPVDSINDCPRPC